MSTPTETKRRRNYTEREGGTVWVVPPSVSTDRGVGRVLAELEEHLASGAPYVLLFDLLHAGLPNAVQRQRLAAHMRDHAVAIRDTVRGIGVVVASPAVRGVVTAIFWIAPTDVPYRVFASRAEAAEWAAALADVELTAALV